MAKDSKRKLMFITLLLMLLLISSAQAILVPTVHAAEPNLQTETVSVLSDVVGLKTERYTTSQSTQRGNQYLSHPQIETSTYLASAEGSLRVTCSYVKDTLQLVYLSDLEGEYSLKQPAANTVEMAKGLLERYQTYSGNSFYSELASMLDDVDANTDLTKYAGDAKLEVTGSDQNRVSYKWTYIDENGVLAERKNIILIYEQGVFKGFFNNWPLYTIVSTPKISSEEATAIALEASKNYTYQVTTENGTEITVSGFTIAPESLGHATLVYLNSKERGYARGGDPFKLYPAWHVPLGFDKFYPGDVSGMTVILWADTGEVCGMNRAITGSGLLPPGEADAVKEAALQTVSQQSIMLPMMVVIAAVIGMVSLVTCKRAKLAGKKLSSKYWAMLLCATIMFSVMLSTPIANAASVTGRSRVYACVDTTKGYRNEGADNAEKTATAEVCNYIGNASLDAGYITSNMYGSWGTTAANVINHAGSDEQNYLNTMVFHAGHLYEFNTAYQDNNGNPITDDAILAQTGLGRHFFTFIWVCAQAEDPTYGIPEAWTHRDNSPSHPHMDDDGFSTPDGSGQCYIGFYGFSPMLSTYYEGYEYSVFNEYNYWGNDLGPCKWFVIFFYYYALDQGYTVHVALDLASQAYFGCDYASSILNTGYNSWWPGGDWDYPGSPMPYLSNPGYFPMDYQTWLDPDRDPNRMRVFGDSSIWLHQPLLTLSASGGLSPTFTIDGQQYYTGNVRLLAKIHNFNVYDIPNYAFTHFSYKGTNYGRPANIQITSDGTLTAHYNWNPTYYTLSISAGQGGTTQSPYTPGDHQCLSYSNAHVVADPNDNWILDKWVLDGDDAGSTLSIDVLMDEPHTLEAVFTPEPSYKFVSSIIDYGEAVYAPENLVGWQPDGQFAIIAAAEPYGVNGWISGALNAQTSGHIYVYGYGSGAIDVYTSAGVNTVYPSGSPGWIDCGATSSPFNSITFVARGFAQFNIDSVKVDPTQYTLTISSSGNGYTTPSGSPQYIINTYASVQAQAYSGWVFDHWLLDGNNAGNNPSINVYMDGPHSLQAVFVQAPPAYVSSITGYGGAYYNPSGMVGSAPNGQYAYITGFAPYNVYGWISGALNSQTAGTVSVYGYGSGGIYVYVSNDGSNWSYLSTIYPSGSAGWINCGTYSNPMNYVRFYAPGGTMSASFYIDCVHVQP